MRYFKNRLPLPIHYLHTYEVCIFIQNSWTSNHKRLENFFTWGEGIVKKREVIYDTNATEGGIENIQFF